MKKVKVIRIILVLIPSNKIFVQLDKVVKVITIMYTESRNHS